MNPLPNQPTQSIQPPYYHSTPTITRNHDQKQANQPYFIDTSKPPPHVIQPQQNPYHRQQSVNEEKVTMKRVTKCHSSAGQNTERNDDHVSAESDTATGKQYGHDD